MTNKTLRDFEEQAHNVGYAYENTQRQYDEYPPKDDVVPIAAAIGSRGAAHCDPSRERRRLYG